MLADSISSDADTMPVCCSEGRAEHESKRSILQVELCSQTHLWSQARGEVRGEELSHVGGP